MDDGAPALVCLNCGAPLGGPYCAQCGQRHRDAADRTLRSLSVEAFNALTSFDSRLWRTFSALLLTPGRLTLDHIEGRRAGYLGPVTVFLLASIVFYAAVPVSASFLPDMADDDELAGLQDPPPPAWLAARIEAGGETVGEFAKRYERRAPEIKKTATILFAPAIALPFLLFFRRRDRLVADHVVFAFHLSAAMMILWAVLSGFLDSFLNTGFARATGEYARPLAGMAFFGTFGFALVWLGIAVRRVYGLRWRWAAPAAFVLFVAVIVLSFVFGEVRNIVALWWLS